MAEAVEFSLTPHLLVAAPAIRLLIDNERVDDFRCAGLGFRMSVCVCAHCAGPSDECDRRWSIEKTGSIFKKKYIYRTQLNVPLV